MDYLILLNEFFVEGLPQPNNEFDLEKEDESKQALSTLSKSSVDPNELLGQQRKIEQNIKCDFKIQNPQFILYENQYELKKSNSLIVDGLIHIMLDLTNERIKLNTMLSDFMIRLKSVRMKRVLKQNKHIILLPMSLTLTGVIDTRPVTSVDDLDRKLQTFVLDIQDVNFNMSPQVLNTSLKMLSSIQKSLDQVIFRILTSNYSYFWHFLINYVSNF